MIRKRELRCGAASCEAADATQRFLMRRELHASLFPDKMVAVAFLTVMNKVIRLPDDRIKDFLWLEFEKLPVFAELYISLLGIVYCT